MIKNIQRTHTNSTRYRSCHLVLGGYTQPLPTAKKKYTSDCRPTCIRCQEWTEITIGCVTHSISAWSCSTGCHFAQYHYRTWVLNYGPTTITGSSVSRFCTTDYSIPTWVPRFSMHSRKSVPTRPSLTSVSSTNPWKSKHICTTASFLCGHCQLDVQHILTWGLNRRQEQPQGFVDPWALL